MSISNMSRLYLINNNLRNVQERLQDYNHFKDMNFSDDIMVMGIAIDRMREILDEMREEDNG